MIKPQDDIDKVSETFCTTNNLNAEAKKIVKAKLLECLQIAQNFQNKKYCEDEDNNIIR